LHRFGQWSVACEPSDGGRVSHLGWNGFELLTQPPVSFLPPRGNLGRYELRPVFAYDDCWPSVETCPFPQKDWQVPDHGELCWLPWEVTVAPDGLVARVESAALPVRFEREMHFSHDRLVWRFKISNLGDIELPCQHVMHPLLPLSAIRALELPEFEAAWDSRTGNIRPERTPDALAAFLLGQSPGTATMVFLQRVRTGRCALVRRDGLRLEVHYPADMFPSLGVWWNNRGYPDEDGCRRDECAFEPVPGPTSMLTQAWQEGTCLRLGAGQDLSWECKWYVQSSATARSTCH
jgi:hypothetical protein